MDSERTWTIEPTVGLPSEVALPMVTRALTPNIASELEMVAE